MKKGIITLIIIAIISLLLGCGIAYGIAQINYLRCGKDKGIITFEDSTLKTIDTGRKYIAVWTFPEETYVEKFVYFYSATTYHTGIMTVSMEDIYGNRVEKEIEDRLCSIYTKSVTNINSRVTSIRIEFEDNEKDIDILGGQAKNTRVFNPYLGLLFTVIIFLAAYFLLFRRTALFANEYIFLVCALTVSMLMIVVEPVYFTGMDEQIHFEKTYELSTLYNTEKVTDSMPVHINAITGHFSHSLCQSIEERADCIRAYNAVGEQETFQTAKYSFDMTHITYIVPAALYRICELINAPAYISIVMGKIGFLLVFLFFSFMAIRIIPIYKNLLTLLLLMPSVLFSTACYSADALIISGLALALAIVIKGLTDTEHKLSPGEQILFVVAFVLGCSAKPIYAPFAIIALFVPERAYKNRSNMVIARTIVCLMVVGLLSSFVLPFLSNPASRGDSRGGATDSASQLSYIFGQPLSYTWILLKNSIGDMGDKLVNSVSSIGYCGELGTALKTGIFAMLPIVAITDRYKASTAVRDVSIRDKIIMTVLCFAVAFLIWTALYISFTPSGSTDINGVQARYFIPMLLPLLILLNSRSISNRSRERNYKALIFSVTGALNLMVIILLMVMPECL